jgi:hypothetical protein
VDITRDVMKMSREGKSVAEMRTVIVERYGRFGPATDRRGGAGSTPADPSQPQPARAGAR